LLHVLEQSLLVAHDFAQSLLVVEDLAQQDFAGAWTSLAGVTFSVVAFCAPGLLWAEAVTENAMTKATSETSITIFFMF